MASSIMPYVKLIPYIKFVQNLKHLSKCSKRDVAAIICSEDLQEVFSIGINGGPANSKYQCLCETSSKYGCIHAEANALVKLHQVRPKKIMLCTLMPCSQCASMIVNEPGGFKYVFYLERWKETLGLQILHNAGIITAYVDTMLEQIVWDLGGDNYGNN